MIRSLFSGVSGMKNHQIRMDVIGNNIANVNTVGFKSGRANFEDTLYQTIKSSSKSTNPAQAGLGTGIASITSNMNSGGLQSTGRSLDLAINGDGFFRFADSNKDFADVSNQLFGRDGTLYISNDGSIVNSNGLNLVAYQWDVATTGNGTEDLTSYKVAAGGGEIRLRELNTDGTAGPTISIELTEGMTVEDVIEAINNKTSITGVEAKLSDDGKNLVFSSETNSLSNFAIDSITCDFNTPAVYEANANMDLTEDLSGINAGAYITITITDENDNDHVFTVSNAALKSLNGIDKTQEDIVNIFKNADGADGLLQEYAVIENINGTLKFYSKASGSNADIAFAFTGSPANQTAVETALGFDFADTATIGADDISSTLGLSTGTYNYSNYGQRALKITQDNLPVGSIQFLSDGTVSGYDCNGRQLSWTDLNGNNYDSAMIKLYTFPNQDGLERVDQNIFTVSNSSGAAQEGQPGTTGYGSVESGYLEMSNVDLTDEFSTMITTQRGYQASSRIITVSDSMLEELLNLKR